MLRVEQVGISKQAGNARESVNKFEYEVRTPRRSMVTVINTSLQYAGAGSIEENGGAAGVRLKK